MRRSSWLLLITSGALCLCLAVAFLLTRGDNGGPLGPRQAEAMIKDMQDAVARKQVGGIMKYVDDQPETHLANLRPDQLRLLLARAFRGSGSLHATCSHIHVTGDARQAVVEFDLSVKDSEPNMIAGDYDGHITLGMRQVDVSHLLGIYHSKEWRIVTADTSGKDPASMGEF